MLPGAPRYDRVAHHNYKLPCLTVFSKLACIASRNRNPRLLQRTLDKARRGGDSRRAARRKYFLYLHSTSQLADESNDLGALDAGGRFGAEEICQDDSLDSSAGTCNTRAAIVMCRFGVYSSWASDRSVELVSDNVGFFIPWHSPVWLLESP